ncbi:MAG: 3-deoxy-manno-octulosonate cytidylyltransferase [Syntrophobacteraceae bacterium]|jgi:3-deoxy-manno-octulosonate cytidylyltransferase (CMP-KDO synthetase)|nr:3-deoxy-manno-octulosonate cytidylyltransferase [Syntrophobacteraceae bacterium]
MRTIGIIPARYASSRFPGKPLAEIAGRPMIQHVQERCILATCLDAVYVATDDSRIEAAVGRFGGRAIMTGAHHASGTDRLEEACRILGLEDDDVVVNIQGDEPLVHPDMIQGLVRTLLEAPPCPMATLAFASSDEAQYRDPNVVKAVVDGKGLALYFSRSPLPFWRDPSGAPPAFLKHLGFYAYRRGFLGVFARLSPGVLENAEKLEQLRALEHGYAIRVGLTAHETHGVDTPEDIPEVEKLLARQGRPQLA